MRFSFKRFLLASGLLLVLFLGWFFYQLLGPSKPITVSPQTTVLTTPLADDGLPDYAKALLDEQRKGVTPENNGAIPFLQAMWPASLEPEHRLAVCQELGMEVPQGNGMSGPYSEKLQAKLLKQLSLGKNDDTEWEQELIFKEQAEEHVCLILDWIGGTPWSREQVPLVADWIDQHAEQYDLLHQAVAKPKLYLPSPSLLLNPNDLLIVMDLSQIQAFRSAARCLTARVNYFLGEGNVAAAWKDTQVTYKISQRMSRKFFIGEFVSIAIEGVAYHSTLQILDDENLTPEVAQEIRDYLQQRPLRHHMFRVLDQGERLLLVATILEISGKRSMTTPDLSDYADELGTLVGLAQTSCDWDCVLKTGNEWYDRDVEAMKIPDWEERQAALALVEADFTTQQNAAMANLATSLLNRKKRSQQVGNLITSLMQPASTPALAVEDRSNTRLQLLQTAAALALYRLGEGDYPDSLEAMVPKYLETLPVDLFHAAPLVYQKTKAGYLLYSRGGNGKDDGGSNKIQENYRGYATGKHTESSAQEFLAEGEEFPTEFGDEFDYSDIEGWAHLQIPTTADDPAIRLPMLYDPLPVFKIRPLEEEALEN